MQPTPDWKSDYPFSSLEEPAPSDDAPELDGEPSSPSSLDLSTLLERFNEPLSGAPSQPRAATTLAAAASALRIDPPRQAQPPRLPAPAPKLSGLPSGSLVSGLVGLALVPMSFLFFLWWQAEQPETAPAEELELSVTDAPAPPAAVAPSSIALSAPERIDATEGRTVAFPIAIEAAAALPARSLVAVSALPQGASLSQGRPYGDSGWSLRPDELAGLQLRLPSTTGSADLRLELISGDGTVLSEAATALSITPPQVATADPVDSAAMVEIAQSEQAVTMDNTAPVEPSASVEQAAPPAENTPAESTASAELKGPVAAPAPAPQRKPDGPAETDEVKVTTVKTVTVQAPPAKPYNSTKPYDGAYALGAAPADPVEWMETKTAVDMHARAEQKSETVKVADGGLKVRVVARDNRWIQVTDPESATTGWIYDRFLKPADAPAQ
jgi:hypothetical protein